MNPFVSSQSLHCHTVWKTLGTLLITVIIRRPHTHTYRDRFHKLKEGTPSAVVGAPYAAACGSEHPWKVPLKSSGFLEQWAVYGNQSIHFIPQL